jgi:hypothetical protein
VWWSQFVTTSAKPFNEVAPADHLFLSTAGTGSINAAATENSSSSAVYSRRYLGFFVHFLWRSSKAVRFTGDVSG